MTHQTYTHIEACMRACISDSAHDVEHIDHVVCACGSGGTAVGCVPDTCCTGKAFTGLVRRAGEGEYKPEVNVLFVHTGGAGGLFAQDWEAERM